MLITNSQAFEQKNNYEMLVVEGFVFSTSIAEQVFLYGLFDQTRVLPSQTTPAVQTLFSLYQMYGIFQLYQFGIFDMLHIN